MLLNHTTGFVDSVHVHDTSSGNNGGKINTLFVDGEGYFLNYDDGTVGIVHATGDTTIQNMGYGSSNHPDMLRGQIGTMYVEDNVVLWSNSGFIGTLYATDNSIIHNSIYSSSGVGIAIGVIDTLHVEENADVNNGGIIKNAIVKGGELYNNDNGTVSGITENIIMEGGIVSGNGNPIANVTAYGGEFRWGYVDNLTIYGGAVKGTSEIKQSTIHGGELHNGYRYGYGTVKDLTMNGGSVFNTETIDRLIYRDGYYNGKQSTDVWGEVVFGTGTITTLTLAGNSANNTGDWGDVENLKFASNGNGILSITASADNLRRMSADTGITFTGIDAENVDLTYGNIRLDLTGLDNADSLLTMFADGFSYASLFGLDEANVTGEVDSFGFTWGEGFESEALFSLMNDDFFGNDWQYQNSAAGVVWTNPNPAAIAPEPATLVMWALGLAGLGLARRRRK